MDERPGPATLDDGGYPLRDEATEPQVPPAPLEPPPPRRRPPRFSPWPMLLVVLLLLGGLGAAYAFTRHHRAPGSAGPSAAAAAPATTAPAPPPPPSTAAAAPAAPAPTHAAPPASPPPAPATVAVPAVTGSSLPRAVSALKQAGLTPVVVHVDSTAPEGRVRSQLPAAGAKLAKGGRVRLRVSVQPLVAVPDVTGMSGLRAVHTLKAAHLDASIRYVPSTEPARTVVSQWPRAGTKVKQGTSVLANVSNGSRPSSGTSGGASGGSNVSVPDVTGEDEATATADLQAAGFTVDSVDTSTSDPNADGTVLDESPSAGTHAQYGSTVTITVGRYSN